MKANSIISRASGITLAALLLGLVGWAANPAPFHSRAAANSQQVFLPMVLKPYTFTQPPRPLNMPVLLDPGHASGAMLLTQPGETQAPVELDQSHAIETVIPAAGGVITATAADGALFSLEIPDGALITDTQVLMIPVAAINGQPLGGSAGAAVQLEPDGLQFLLPLTLSIQTSAPIPVDSELTLSWHGDGQEFHRYPLLIEHPYPEVVFRIMHFSGYTYLGDNISIPIDNGFPMPTDPEDQFKQAWDEVVRREREAQANGWAGNPNFHEELIDLLRAYYDQIIKPIMVDAENDCDTAESGAISKAQGWEKEADMLRVGDELAQEREEYDASFIRILQNCWQKRTQPCLNRHDLKQWQEAVLIARQGQMFNLNFDPNSVPDCDCSGFESISAWSLAYTVSFNRSAQGVPDGSSSSVSVSVNHEQSGTLLLDNKNGWPPYPGWDNTPGGVRNMPSGSASIDDHSTYTLYNGKQYSAATVGSGITGGYGYLEFDEYNCTYTLRLDVSTHVVETATEMDPVEHNMYVLGIYVLDHNAYSLDPATAVLSDSGDFDAGVGGPYIEHMDLSNGWASGNLFSLLGSNVGYGHASWALTPIP